MEAATRTRNGATISVLRVHLLEDCSAFAVTCNLDTVYGPTDSTGVGREPRQARVEDGRFRRMECVAQRQPSPTTPTGRRDARSGLGWSCSSEIIRVLPKTTSTHVGGRGRPIWSVEVQYLCSSAMDLAPATGWMRPRFRQIPESRMKVGCELTVIGRRSPRTRQRHLHQSTALKELLP